MGVLDILKRDKPGAKKRQFLAAATGRLWADWNATNQSADQEITPALQTLRDRCREQARNNDYARRYLHLLNGNVVGPAGIRMQSKRVDNSGNLDRDGNQAVEQAFNKWSRRVTANGRMSWIDAQRLCLESVARDGEVLVKINRDPDLNSSGFAIQFIDAEYLDVDMNSRAKNGEIIRHGVQMDRYGRPTAYHLFNSHPGDAPVAMESRTHTVVSADDMLHVYRADRADQTRGVPWLATALPRLKMLSGYEEAELVAARLGSAKSAYLRPSVDGVDEFTGDSEDGFAPEISAAPGEIQMLPPGFDLVSWDTSHPSTAFANFEAAILRGIASGLNVSYQSLSSDLSSTNYSSGRLAELGDRDAYKMIQRFLIDHFCEPIVRMWLREAIARNQIFFGMTRFEEFADALKFIPRSWSWVDPSKEANANLTALQAGLITIGDIEASQYGRDVEELFEAHQAEQELAAQYGLELAFQPFGASTPIAPDTEEPPNE